MKKTFLKLLDTITRNRLFNVIAFNVALSDKHGNLVDFEKPWYRQSTAAFMKEGRKEGRIRTLTGDWILGKLNSKQNIRIVKIDVEGAELMVLRGMREVLISHEPFVIVETGNHYKRFGYSYDDLLRFMYSVGYKPAHLLLDDNGGVIQDCSCDLISKPGNVVFEKQ